MLIDVLNTEVQGKKDTTYIIDENLAIKLCFIQSGSFNKNEGEPILKLIGNVVPVDGMNVAESVAVRIDYDDIMVSFLSKKSLSREKQRHF